MAALGLALRDIEHVAEQAAERRAQNMQDLEARAALDAAALRRRGARRRSRMPAPMSETRAQSPMTGNP